MSGILLSVIVNFYNMRREAARTLQTLTSTYQKGVGPGQYEVIAVDNGSSEPLSSEMVENFGPNFRYVYHDTDESSPIEAINRQIKNCQGELVMIMIDGAHMLTPGIIGNALRVAAVWVDPFVTVVGFHLGRDIQNLALEQGYNQEEEDKLLATVDWRSNGYDLFKIGQALSYDCAGWFAPLAESNCFMMKKESYFRIGGLDAHFSEAGGGLAILDFFRRAMEVSLLDYVVLLGEGSFHQFHGGVASNASFAEHPWDRFHEQYFQLRGHPYEVAVRRPILLGSIGPEALACSAICARAGFRWWREEVQRPHDMNTYFPTIGYIMQAARKESEMSNEQRALERELTALQCHCDLLAHKNQEQVRVLTEINQSLGWRCLSFWRQSLNRFLPAASRRRKLYDSLLKYWRRN